MERWSCRGWRWWLASCRNQIDERESSMWIMLLPERPCSSSLPDCGGIRKRRRNDSAFWRCNQPWLACSAPNRAPRRYPKRTFELYSSKREGNWDWNTHRSCHQEGLWLISDQRQGMAACTWSPAPRRSWRISLDQADASPSPRYQPKFSQHRYSEEARALLKWFHQPLACIYHQTWFTHHCL